MKVLLVTLEYPPAIGGVANYYANLVKYWPEKQKIFVLDNKERQLVNRHCPFIHWLPAITAINRETKKIKPDHILVGHILPLGSAVYFWARFKNIPYSVFLHGMDFSLSVRSGRKKFLTKKILISAQNIICASSYTAHLVKNFVPQQARRRVKIVNPGVSPPSQPVDHLAKKLAEKYNLSNKLVLFSLGRLVKRKGFDLVIQSLPEIFAARPQTVYFIAGSGPDKAWLLEQAKKLPVEIQEKIIFLGRVSEEEKWAWLKLADIFIMPSRTLGSGQHFFEKGNYNSAQNYDFEGFGIVYLEANLAGTPVIAVDSGGVRDAVVNGLNGLLLEEPSKEEVVKAVVRLGLDKNLRQRLGEQGEKRAQSEFNWQDKARQVYEMIH